MRFDVKAVALLFTMRSIIGSFILINSSSRMAASGVRITLFISLVLVSIVLIWIGHEMIRFKGWTWYVVVPMLVFYLFFNTGAFMLGETDVIYPILLDSSLIIYMYLRKSMFTSEEFLQRQEIKIMGG